MREEDSESSIYLGNNEFIYMEQPITLKEFEDLEKQISRTEINPLRVGESF